MTLQIKYVSGSYDSEDGFRLLDKEISEHELVRKSHPGTSRRLFYLALPPSVYPSVCKMIRSYCMNQCKFFLTIFIGMVLANESLTYLLRVKFFFLTIL